MPKNIILIRFDFPWFGDSKYMDVKSMEITMNWGIVNHNIRHSFSDMLPSNTTFVDLSGTEEEIFANMKNNTRYNIRLRKKGRDRKGRV